MTGKTHVAAGLLVGAITVDHYHTDLFSTVTVICLAISGSLLPDICHTRSKIGSQFKILSLLVSTIFGHRTFTHSLLFLGMIGYLLILIQTPTYYLVIFIVTMASHVILDMLTPRGVQLFYPLPQNIHFPITVKTGGWMDLSLATALTVGAAYTLF
ncbi:metal-dependent hydrolase, partial [Staphylococcus epidermidis]|uniref:metal-dependent hydrolase n=1 Tax=Staphylococcus epidermidis TaxID=1282 RepID=UPI00103FD41D